MLARKIAASITLAGLAMSPASAGIFINAPDAIVCSIAATANRPGSLVVFYVDARGGDGRTLYKSLGAPISLSVDAKGVINARNIKECHGKSVREMRAAGRAFDFR